MFILSVVVIVVLFAIALRLIGVGRLPAWLPFGRRGVANEQGKAPRWILLLLAAVMAIMSVTQLASYLSAGDESRIVLILLGGGVAIGLVVTAIRQST